MSFDLYPMDTLAGKKRLLPKLAEQRAVVIFYHDPKTPCLRLLESDGKITTAPVQ